MSPSSPPARPANLTLDYGRKRNLMYVGVGAPEFVNVCMHVCAWPHLRDQLLPSSVMYVSNNKRLFCCGSHV